MLRERTARPRTQTYVSYEEYLRLAPDNKIVEWVNGKIIRHIPASTKHQDLVSFLVALLRAYATALKLGKVITAPYEAKLWFDPAWLLGDLPNHTLCQADMLRIHPNLSNEDRSVYQSLYAMLSR